MSKTRSSLPLRSTTYGTRGMAIISKQARPREDRSAAETRLDEEFGEDPRRAHPRTRETNGYSGQTVSGTVVFRVPDTVCPEALFLFAFFGHSQEHFIHQAKILGLLGVEVTVALGLAFDDLDRLTGMFDQDI